jgi:hypothetical protein
MLVKWAYLAFIREKNMRKMMVIFVLSCISTALCAAKGTPDGPLPAADDYAVLKGHVTVGTIDAHTIGVVVDDGGSLRHIFRLWTSASIKPFRAISQSASVEYRGDELIVMAADQAWFYALTISGDARAPRPPAGFTATRYAGYGLNHEIRPIAPRPAVSGRHIIALDCSDFDLCLDNKDYDLGGGGGGAVCDAGGIGSSSCSTSNTSGSCSVTCSTGYACCTAASTNSNAYCRCKSF